MVFFSGRDSKTPVVKKISGAIARRKAERKKWVKKFPGRNMLWFGGILCFVDGNGQPISAVKEAEVVSSRADGAHGLGLAGYDLSPRQPTTYPYGSPRRGTSRFFGSSW